jgi:hypothetical protein
MGTDRDIVIIALLRRMGGPQYLEWDELEGIERPQFSKEGEYLVVRLVTEPEQRPGLPGTSDEIGIRGRTETPP